MKPEEFVRALSSLHFENAFNPYRDLCPIHDNANAPKLRADALLGILEVAISREIDSIWIGRDLGYRGGRRSGLALTDDIHVKNHAARWGRKVDRYTKGQPLAERTAAVIWDVLDDIHDDIFLWNVFPFHPHEFGNSFTNRNHSPTERIIGEEFLEQLIFMLKPKRIIAIGNDAHRSATRLVKGNSVFQLRHPSYGGQNIFLSQIRELYKLNEHVGSLL